MKALLYKGDGWIFCYKCIADGHLQWPHTEKEAKLITAQQYRWLMDELNQLSREMLLILYTNLHKSFCILSEQSSMIQRQNEQLVS